MKNTHTLLAENIQKYRKKCNMTQEMLADKLGVSTQAVSKWENGKSAPDIYLLPQLADCFGCSMDDLFSREVNRGSEQADFPKVTTLEEAIRIYEAVLEDPMNNYEKLFSIDLEMSEKLAKHLIKQKMGVDDLFLPQMRTEDIDNMVRECMKKGERIDRFLPFMSRDLLLELIYRKN